MFKKQKKEPKETQAKDKETDKAKGEPEKLKLEGVPEYAEEEDLDECDLTCLNRGPKRKVHEFIGPVKLVFVDVDPSVYCRRILGAGFLMLVNLLIGGIMVHMIYFGIITLRSEKWAKKEPWILTHIFMYYFGFQVFMPIAILCINPIYGPSSALRPLQRKTAHLANQITAIVLILGATAHLFLGFFNSKFSTLTQKLTKLSPHSMAGFLGIAFMITAIATGPFAYLNAKKCVTCWNCLKACHIFFGLPSYIFATVSFVMGILNPIIKKEFKKTYENVPYILMFLAIAVCLIVCIGPIYKMKTCQFRNTH